MKVVILAGGMGARISEESHLKPKPMISIGEQPILWHIMKIYSSYGYNDFVICSGYKGYCIKDYFAHYFLHEADITINFRENSTEVIHSHTAEPWEVTLANTGLETMTGGRVKKVQNYIGNEPFMLTYGDGVGDVNIIDLVKFHKSHGKMVTLTSVQPIGRFGSLSLSDSNHVEGFVEKPKGDGSWINAGFFVCQPEIFDYLKDVDLPEILEEIAKAGQLMAYKHDGFWHPMDTMRDRIYLEELYEKGDAPWMVWEDKK